MVLDFVFIIPTFNEEKTIEKTLQHIRKQKTRTSFNAVVVDGGSTDRTVEIAQKYVKVLKSSKKGKAYQLNYGAALTNSKIIVFLDADTFIPYNYIERIKTAFEQDSELWACGGHISYVGKIHGGYHFLIILQAIFNFPLYAFFHFIWLLLQRLPKAHFKIMNFYYFFSLSMVIYYIMRQSFGSPELSGTNICIRRKIFEEIRGFQSPNKLGVDWLFCHLMRNHIRKIGRGKMRMFPSLVVETDVRHLTLFRSLKRLKTHRDFQEKQE